MPLSSQVNVCTPEEANKNIHWTCPEGYCGGFEQ